jgi:hypothetical protein
MAIRGDVYIIEYLAASEALRKASEQAIEASRDSSLPEEERARAGALSIDLDKQRLLLKVAHETFMNEFATPSPPSEADVEKAIGLAQELARLVSDRLKAEANLAAVIGVISALGQLTTKPAVPADAAEGMQNAVSIAAAAAITVANEKLLAASTTVWLRKVKAAAAKP